jgi:rod shape determining protein RodA
LLLGVLVLLAAYGVTVVYSATINTLGLEGLTQRQIFFVVAGVALVLVTAAIDYRLLEIAQHPFPSLTPLVLVLACVAITVSWQAGIAERQLGSAAPLASGASQAARLVGASELLSIALGVVLLYAVYAFDRLVIETLNLPFTRLAILALVISAAGVALLSLAGGPRAILGGGGSAVAPGPPGSSLAGAATDYGLTRFMPYVAVVALAVGYLIDCLALRVTDLLRNPVYVLMLVLLGLTLTIGQASGGSQRWLGAGTVQPSELAKIMTIVVLAKFLADREEQMERFSTVLTSIALVAVPMVMIYLQPDLGTSLTLIAIWVGLIWTARIRFRHLLALVAAGVLLLPIAWFGLEDYMRDRLLLFVDPSRDPDAYFNVHQALVSIGSGGWTGKGLTHGTQSQLHFLRVRHTDFIFAVTAEELGFLGAVAMIGLMGLLLWRIVRVAERARDTFGRLVAAGVAALILFQTVINVGMNLGLLPVTGIPLPFVSYGGSSLLTLMVGVGLVESVAMRHKKLEFD